MFSKILFKPKLNILILSAFVLTSCRWMPGSSLNIGEKNPPTGVAAVDMSRFSCLRDIGSKVSDYFKSNLDEAGVANLATCIRTALERFEFLTKDNDDGSYRPDSLINYLNAEYLYDQKISSAFGAELMTIKTLVLGGSNKRINQDELHELSKIVSFVETHAIAHLPYIKIYRRNVPGEAAQVSKLDLLNAREQVRTTSRAIADILSKSGGSYSLVSLSHFFEEMRAFLNWEDQHPSGLSSTQVMDIVRALKVIVSGDESEVIKAVDWQRIADAVSVSYGLLLNQDVSMRGQKLTIDPALDTLVGSINDGLLLVDRVIEVQPDKVILFGHIDELISSLKRAGFLPNKIRESSLISVYRHLISHAFQDPMRPRAERDIRGLSHVELAQISSEFKLWSGAQKYLSDNAALAFGFSFDPSDEVQARMLDIMNTFNFSKHLAKNSIPDNKVNHEIELIMNNLSPMFRDSDERAYIAPEDELAAYEVQNGLANLTRMNLMRALVRVLIRSFSTKERIMTMGGVTEDEMQAFYEAARPLGEDLQFMEPPRHEGKNEKGRRYFVDGSMFAMLGDGVSPKAGDEKDILSFYETVQLLSMMWSGGKIRDQLYSTISEKCWAEGFRDMPLDIIKNPKIDRKCFLKHFADNEFSEFSNLPNFKETILKLTPRSEINFVSGLEDIAKISCEDPKYIEKGELATMSTALHYVESIFAVYDRDKNDVLDSEEVMRSFSRFYGYLYRQILESRDKEYSVKMLKAIFVFLINEKRLPDGISDGSSILIASWKYDNDPHEFDALLTSPLIVAGGAPTGQNAMLAASASVKKLPEVSTDRFGILNILKVMAEASRESNEKKFKCP